MPNFREGKLIYGMCFKFHWSGPEKRKRKRILCPRSIFTFTKEVLKGVCVDGGSKRSRRNEAKGNLTAEAN